MTAKHECEKKGHALRLVGERNGVRIWVCTRSGCGYTREERVENGNREKDRRYGNSK